MINETKNKQKKVTTTGYRMNIMNKYFKLSAEKIFQQNTIIKMQNNISLNF